MTDSSATMTTISRRCALALTVLSAATSVPAESTREAASEVRVSSLVSVPGASAPGGERVSFIAPSFLGGIVEGGTLTGRSTTQLTDSGAGWVNNQFNGTAGRFLVEITEGLAEGWWAEITATVGGTNTLTTSRPVPSSVLVGQQYRIRRLLTLADIAGSGDSTPLAAGLNASVADNVIYVAPGSGAQTLYFPGEPLGGGAPAWQALDGSPAAEAALPPGSGIVVRRRSTTGAALPLTGFARSGALQVPVAVGQNLVGLGTARPVTLSQLGLVNGSSLLGFAPGANFSSGDQLHLALPSGGTATYFYSDVPGYVGWFDSAYQPAGSVVIPANAAFFLRRKGANGFDWNVPAATASVP